MSQGKSKLNDNFQVIGHKNQENATYLTHMFTYRWCL